MSNVPVTPSKTFSRPLRMEDLLEPCTKNINDNNYHNNTIPKNQKDFGHKKRIKP